MIFQKGGVETGCTIPLFMKKIPTNVIIHLQQAARAREHSYCDNWQLSLTATSSNVATVTLQVLIKSLESQLQFKLLCKFTLKLHNRSNFHSRLQK